MGLCRSSFFRIYQYGIWGQEIFKAYGSFLIAN